MKRFRLLLLTALAGMLLALSACSKDDSSAAVPDPENTVEAWIPIGGWINFNNRALGMTDQKVFRAGEIHQLEFSRGVPKKGLGNITQIPTTSYSWWAEVVPGCGYVVHLVNDSFYGYTESWARLYVVDFTYNEAHATTGVTVKYELNWWPE